MNTLAYESPSSELAPDASRGLDTLMGLVFGFGFIYIFSKAKISVLAPWQVMTFLPFLLLIYFSTIIVHEAGHWFGGQAVGLRGVKFIVMWWRLERRGSRWKISWTKRLPGLGGMVIQYPTIGQRLRRSKFVAVAAGPVANLVTGLPALALGYLLNERPDLGAQGTFLSVGLAFYGLLSVVMGIGNLLPRKLTTGMSNDGHLLLRLLRRDPVLERQLACSAVVGSSYVGLRPRDWEADLLKRLTDSADDSILDCQAFLFAYSHHLDAGQASLAQPYLASCLEKLTLLPPASQQAIYCEAAYFAAIHAQDALQAQRWLDQAQEIKAFEKNEGYFTQAVVAWSAGRQEEARAHFDRGKNEALVTDENDAGTYALALDRIADLRARLHR